MLNHFRRQGFRQSGCARSYPVVAGCGGDQPGQILDNFARDNPSQEQRGRPRSVLVVAPCLPRRRNCAQRRGNRRRDEIETERHRQRASVEGEIDLVVAGMHELLPRNQASAIGIAYARYSTEFQHSIADQLRGIFEFAVKNGIFIPREHVHSIWQLAVAKIAGRDFNGCESCYPEGLARS